MAYDGPKALSVIDQWEGNAGKPAFHFGPTVPLQPGTTSFTTASIASEASIAPPGIATKISTFLDAALATKGKSSVVYISFGTVFWWVYLHRWMPRQKTHFCRLRPANPDHIWTLLETLSEHDVPFVSTFPN
jgi:hypothetical protein